MITKKISHNNNGIHLLQTYKLNYDDYDYSLSIQVGETYYPVGTLKTKSVIIEICFNGCCFTLTNNIPLTKFPCRKPTVLTVG